METEKIEVLTENGDLLEVAVLSKNASVIQVVLGEGVHCVKCELKPIKSGEAYVGSVMGREIIYERSATDVQKDIDRLNPHLRHSRPQR
ncbi:hypothetical protein MNBD_GAMMA12-2729 [hydrothermal vent metagenome]|uniref:Uncharacterized protein n=1 Tax=hydrothermal vent metagenome TaxID=652676 RepID=A0A3B0YYP5_9ZZZZ